MRTFYKSLVFGLTIALLKYLFWKLGLEYWDIGLISISGLVAGIFFILASMFQAALRDYKGADESVCKIQGSICSMNDVIISAELMTPDKFKSKHLSRELVKTFQIIKSYIENEKNFFQLQNHLNKVVNKSLSLDRVVQPDKIAIYYNYLNQLRIQIGYLEYSKSLHFPKVGYNFLNFFIFCLIFLQIFNKSDNVFLEVIFLFSFATVLIFFAGLISDLDHPFLRRKAAFRVDLSPLKRGEKAIKDNIKD
ncbi:hypothetical protein K9M50_01145 [Patescibacteria group bacterium]|nr:hypothetical protein [Patescibacteria group bacterium]